MKKLLSGILALTALSCGTNTTDETVETSLKVYEIDGCEYIGSKHYWYSNAILTHKGNCIYCLKRNKKR